MNLEDYIKNQVRVERQAKLVQSDQLTLGELILKLEPIVKHQDRIIEKYKHEAEVRYDFEYLFPTSIDSWRGIYAELALNYELPNSNKQEMNVSSFVNMLKECIGKTFEGYKGGDFVMGKTTPIWVANYGNAGNTAVVDVIDNEYEIILVTGYREA